MKSTAFNLAFKVHRSELTFAEGLLKSLEADAQRDFIEALNSLAGEMRYDLESLDSLIHEARRSMEPEKKPKYDTQVLKEELAQLKKNRNELLDSIKSLEARISLMKPTIIPGVNAFFVFLIGFVISMIFYLLGLFYLATFLLIGSLLSSASSLIYDLGLLKKQQTDIAQKKILYLGQISQLQADIETQDQNIEEKEVFLQSVRGNEKEESPQRTPDFDM